MRRLALVALASVLPVLVRAEEPPPVVQHEVGVNLVVNPSFEKPKPGQKYRPLGWEEPDELTSFWDKQPGRGRVLRLDTDVLQSEHDRRLEEMKIPRADRPKPRRKAPTVDPKYDTVGGNKGATLRCDPIPVEPKTFPLYSFTFTLEHTVKVDPGAAVVVGEVNREHDMMEQVIRDGGERFDPNRAPES